MDLLEVWARGPGTVDSMEAWGKELGIVGLQGGWESGHGTVDLQVTHGNILKFEFKKNN